MTVDQKPLAQITEEAIRLLIRELGVVSALRFMNQFSTGLGNYTEDRRIWIDTLELYDIVAQIENKRMASK